MRCVPDYCFAQPIGPPLAKTKNHKILILDPFVIEAPLTCPYSMTHSFNVVEGKILTA